MRSNRVSKTHFSLSKSLTHPFRSLCFPSAAGRHALQIPCARLPELLRPPPARPPAARRHSPSPARRHGHPNSPPPAAALHPLALRPWRWSSHPRRRCSRAADQLAPSRAPRARPSSRGSRAAHARPSSCRWVWGTPKRAECSTAARGEGSSARSPEGMAGGAGGDGERKKRKSMTRGAQ